MSLFDDSPRHPSKTKVFNFCAVCKVGILIGRLICLQICMYFWNWQIYIEYAPVFVDINTLSKLNSYLPLKTWYW
jgi:hypothetical protein